MSAPRATYRLQFRDGFDFARAVKIMPYLARLGVSHVYASPLQAARAGSTHGYDGIDFNVMDPSLGGDAGFRALTEAMRRSGLRLLLDIVPNHMGVTPENAWWRDVLMWGSASRFAGHFDIDWRAPQLLLPILGRSYAETLAAGELKLAFDAEAGAFTLSYYGTVLPLTPPSYGLILGGGDDALQALARRFALSGPETADEVMRELAAPGQRAAIEARAAVIGGDAARLHALLERQPWRLQNWRNARERLTYRRFFEISDLVGVRVEDPRVFSDVHRWVLELVRAGVIDGLRIDHVDGLADPLDYLRRLRAAMDTPDVYVVVEKILGSGEALRADWPIAGSTGYEFIASLGDLLTDGGKAADLDAAYAGFIGARPDVAAEAHAIKRQLMAHNLASEREVLARALFDIAQARVATRDLGPDALREAIVELAAAMPVYRTYIDARGPSDADREILRAAMQRVLVARRVEAPEAIAFLIEVLTLAVDEELQAPALRFAFRFQQTTGPLMAKSIEDTLFYRFNRLVALNEVGGEPDRAARGVGHFHAAMAARLQTQPTGLSATATHDTKRGEDARARLYVLSEMPEAWALAAHRWTQLNKRHGRDVGAARWPEPAMEWFIYQSLLGAWPFDLEMTDSRGLAALRERMQQLVQKAAREAKVHTTWTSPNESYETALAQFLDGLLDVQRSRAFLEDFLAMAQPVFVAGAVNSLTQLLLKLVAPGVPDIYQGTELWDLAMVDPDNRRAVDFAAREELAAQVESRPAQDLVVDWRSGAMKMRLMLAGLRLRRDLDGWERARMLPALAHGAQAHHVVGFARVLDHASVLAVGVRLPLSLLGDTGVPHVPAKRWGDTHLVPPDELVGVALHDVVTGETLTLPRAGMPMAQILARYPVALLSTTPASSRGF